MCHLIFGFVAGAAWVDDLWLLVVALLHVFAQDFAQRTVVLVPNVSVFHHRRPGHTLIFTKFYLKIQSFDLIVFDLVILDSQIYISIFVFSFLFLFNYSNGSALILIVNLPRKK